MLARTHRFHGYGSLKAVYSRGSTVRNGLITARYAFRGNQKSYRVAVVVSRKVSKSAVVRNRIRRRVYEAIRHQDLLVPAGLDLVLTVFNDQVAVVEAGKLETAVRELLEKIAGAETPVRHAIVKPDTGKKGDT